MFKILFYTTVLLALIAVAHSEDSSEEDNNSKYDFEWDTHDDSSETHFGHSEKKNAGRTEGSYYVMLPDGRMQTVNYYIDGESGYVADVTYSNSHEDMFSRSHNSNEDDESSEE